MGGVTPLQANYSLEQEFSFDCQFHEYFSFLQLMSIKIRDAVRKMPCFNLRSLSLVVDDISDDLLITFVHSVPRLVELDIEGQTFYGAIGTGLDQHWTAGSEVLRMSNCPLNCSK
ncbi:hypothetical protein CQW23_18156 [Capsicum baccatum]|uniref:Uncharacterized protein n=1 Tax=Capsicum baccatum TaxID=33114 RepID=A0A2G2WFX0_CAPBA|nr:hypothetical protein CQW23_18156 [Capsicum baccatum]